MQVANSKLDARQVPKHVPGVCMQLGSPTANTSASSTANSMRSPLVEQPEPRCARWSCSLPFCSSLYPALEIKVLQVSTHGT